MNASLAVADAPTTPSQRRINLLDPVAPVDDSVLPARWQEVFRIESPCNVLMVVPKFPITFWGLYYSFRDVISGPKYILPPLPLLTVAAFLPPRWAVRLVDENIRDLTEDDLDWADVVMVNAMVVQLDGVRSVTRRAHDRGKTVVLGGPDPSIAPERYAEVDYIHQGEIGDATIDLFLHLARHPQRPDRQRIFTVAEKVPIAALPPPRNDLIRPDDYLSMSLQFAVGCPFNCEFCDIIEIYGRKPRVKRPEQVLQELDGILATGYRGSVFFVDDNFIGNLPKVKALIPHLIRWQEEHGFPFQFYTEASVNLAEHEGLLKDMRKAGFYAVFLGIETPDPEDLKALQKSQNARRPLLESMRILQEHGLQIWAGLIVGLDTDRPDTGDQIVNFVETTGITAAMVNLLSAPAGTQLWRRLQKEGRLVEMQPIEDPSTDTNVVYKQGNDVILRQAQGIWEQLYEPKTFLERIRRNIEISLANSAHFSNLISWKVKLRTMPRMLWHMGIKARYRWQFWKLLGWCLRRGAFDAFAYQMGLAYHCIRFRDRVLEVMSTRAQAADHGLSARTRELAAPAPVAQEAEMQATSV